MLFLVTHSHTLEQCPAREGEETLASYYRSLQADVAVKLGVKVVGLYTAPAQHAQFLLVEADNFDSLNEYLKPLYLRGRVELFPVTSFSQRMETLRVHVEQQPPADYYCMTCRTDVPQSDVEGHRGHKLYTHKEMEELWPHELGGEAGSG